jgi:hypothetical protein
MEALLERFESERHSRRYDNENAQDYRVFRQGGTALSGGSTGFLSPGGVTAGLPTISAPRRGRFCLKN